MNKKEAMEIELPKWCQCFIYGKPVSKEVASDVILRTDSFFLGNGGNNDDFNKKAWDLLGLDVYNDRADFSNSKAWEKHEERTEEIYHKLTIPTLCYLRNDWLSCAFVEGPHGWMHPDGKIGFCDNIGKWPSVEQVWEELKSITATWKELDLYATLMNGEDCEDNTKPVVTLHAKGGKVRVADNPTKEELWKIDCSRESSCCNIDPRGENHYSIQEVETIFKPLLKKYLEG